MFSTPGLKQRLATLAFCWSSRTTDGSGRERTAIQDEQHRRSALEAWLFHNQFRSNLQACERNFVAGRDNVPPYTPCSSWSLSEHFLVVEGSSVADFIRVPQGLETTRDCDECCLVSDWRWAASPLWRTSTVRSLRRGHGPDNRRLALTTDAWQSVVAAPWNRCSPIGVLGPPPKQGERPIPSRCVRSRTQGSRGT